MFYKKFFGHDSLKEGQIYSWKGRWFVVKKGIPREVGIYTETQDQTKKTFGFKWNQLETYESEAVKKRSYTWLVDRYFGGKESAKQEFINKNKGCLFYDAGCGSGFSILLLFGEHLNDFHYLGIDISESINVAKARFEEKGIRGEFIQADIANLPNKEPVFDVIFSEGVLHHTDSTRESLGKLVSLLRPGGSILFYVYRKKGPIREFVDDYIREKIRGLSDEEAWEKLKPLTKLGKTLGDLKSQIKIDEDIDVLDIPKGSYDLQRFFYWHVAKLFYNPDYSLEEMNHVNFDWYRPLNAHRQTPEEVKSWCEDFGLDILRLHAEEAGITVVARKK